MINSYIWLENTQKAWGVDYESLRHMTMLHSNTRTHIHTYIYTYRHSPSHTWQLQRLLRIISQLLIFILQFKNHRPKMGNYITIQKENMWLKLEWRSNISESNFMYKKIRLYILALGPLKWIIRELFQLLCASLYFQSEWAFWHYVFGFPAYKKKFPRVCCLTESCVNSR